MISLALQRLPSKKGAYLVGGTVRDLLLKRQPVDYDLAVAGRPEELADVLLQSTSGRRVRIGKAGQSVLRVITDAGLFDICPLQGGRIEEDLARRDFTVNAMAVSLASGRLIDPFDGRSDLAQGRIRSVSGDVFAADAVRLLRAYRVAAQLDFEIERETAAAITQQAWRIGDAAGERLREELFKLLAGSHVAGYLVQMLHSGLLPRLIPELEPLAGCRQSPPHRKDAMAHTLATVACLEALLADPPQGLLAQRASVEPLNSPRAGGLLKFAALLHDIGKPHCRSLDGRQRIHFYGHAAVGARLALQVGKRLRFSNRESGYVTSIIRGHQRPLMLYGEWCRGRFSERAAARLFKVCGSQLPDLMLHALADQNAKSGPDCNGKSFARFGAELVERYFGHVRKIRSQPPLITGHDLIERFGLAPSPLFKAILEELDTARLAGSITTRAEAEKVVVEMLARIQGKSQCKNPSSGR